MEQDRILALAWAREDAHADSDPAALGAESVVDRAYDYLFFLNGLDPMTEEELQDIEDEVTAEEAAKENAEGVQFMFWADARGAE